MKCEDVQHLLDALTDTELKEAIIHLAFYAGWPRAMSAVQVAKNVLGNPDARENG